MSKKKDSDSGDVSISMSLDYEEAGVDTRLNPVDQTDEQTLSYDDHRNVELDAGAHKILGENLPQKRHRTFQQFVVRTTERVPNYLFLISALVFSLFLFGMNASLRREGKIWDTRAVSIEVVNVIFPSFQRVGESIQGKLNLDSKPQVSVEKPKKER